MFCEISKYIMIILLAIYTFECFAVFLFGKDKEKQDGIYRRQNLLMVLINIDGYLVLYGETEQILLLGFCVVQLLFFLIVISGYRLLYEKCSTLLVNNMCMLMSIGFLILSRLSIEKAIKQFMVAVLAAIIALGIPFLIKKIRFIRNLTWLYGMIGIGALTLVAVAGATSYGAKLSFSIQGISMQPSEFVKIVYVFFVAGMLYKKHDFMRVCIASLFAALHVIILVASKDLGGALIYFAVYLVMLYVATRQPFYFVSGIVALCLASVLSYQLFGHVRTRVIAWRDPVSVIENEGYQICQSLFAIGTGGWFGVGLGQGMPNKIPKVEQDFVFSAIAEEMGGLFGICLIMICMSCYLMFLNIAMQLKDVYYKLVALGLGTTYAFQIFLAIGGNIKFIPSTGVTLPLISYGGSSLLSTTIIFAIIQGFYILRERGDYKNEKIREEYQEGDDS